MSTRSNKAGSSGRRGSAPPPARRRQRVREPFVQRYRSMIILAALGGGAVVFIAVLFILAGNGGGGSTTSASPADPALVEKVTTVPEGVFDTIGAGTANNPPKAIQADALTQDGKPELLYVGGEFCPYCAAERWSMVLALSRFGTFTNLQTTRSAPADVYPNTATFSFYGSSYQSDYLSFTPVEQYSNERSGSGYATLQSLTDAQQQLVAKYSSGIPFMDFGGKLVQSGASYNPGILNGQDWDSIASKLTQTDSTEAQAIVGTANVLTAAICEMTGGQPANVCSSAGVQAGAHLLP
jgi:hypothetical protein